MNAEKPCDVIVADTWAAANDVLALTLTSANGQELPSWQPGAHIDVYLPSGLVRQYSLCGDPSDSMSYRIAVLRIADGRGGSAELHAVARPGTRLRIGSPRNHFELRPAAHHLFVAGGIGITPLLAMARRVAKSSASWRLVYGARNRAAMAFVDDLLVLGAESVDLVAQDDRGVPDLSAIVAEAPAGAAVYCCGPPAMIDAVIAAQNALRPDVEVRFERFTAVAEDPSASDTAFELVLARTGVTVPVPPGMSMLQAVRAVCPSVMSSCERGVCSACETAVLDGVPDHRDSVLTAAERTANNYVMLCVSRAKSARLVLDL